MQSPILPPRLETLLGPLLASLPAASISPQPPTALLPLLSPILRQRVQLLSEATKDPWLPLLCYDSANASKLETVVTNERLEPHPVSGEVEVDWEDEVEIRYKRIDEETLQSLVTLRDLDLSVKLVWCVNDEIGGGDGWRIGEVGVADKDESAWGQETISGTEATFKSASTNNLQARKSNPTNGRLPTPDTAKGGDLEDDDDYWAQYDSTPAQTPAPPAAPLSKLRQHDGTEEDAYYSQYADVQPALDNHDPDEAQQNGDIETSLGRDEITSELQQNLSSHSEVNSEMWSDDPSMLPTHTDDFVVQPRPSSSAGSSGCDTVARLEKAAEGDDARATNELGIKQHIGTSVKSLWRLARVAGIERTEFERIIRTELDVLGMLDDDVD